MASNKLEYLLTIKDQATKTLQKFSKAVNKQQKGFKDYAKSAVKNFGLAGVAIGGASVAIFNLAKQGGKLLDVEHSFASLAKNAGRSSQQMLEDFHNATHNMVSDADIMKSAVTASMLGIPVDKMAGLMKIASQQAIAMGEDMSYMLTSIVTGIGRASPLILDNLGIELKMGDVYQAAADKLGKKVQALTEEEKKQALTNAVLEWGAEKEKELGGNVRSNTEAYQQLTAQIANLKNQMEKHLNETLTPYVSKIVEWANKNPQLAVNISLVVAGLIALSTTILILTPLINGLIAVIGLLKLVLMPISLTTWLVIAAIIALIAIGWELYAHWDALKAMAQAVFMAVFQFGLNMVNGLVAKFGWLIAKSKLYWNMLVAATRQMSLMVKKWFFTIPTHMLNALTKVGAVIGSYIGKFFNWGRNIANSFVNGFKSAISHIVDAAKNAINSVRGFLEGHSPAKKGPFSKIDEWGFNIGNAWVKGFQEAMGGISLPTMASGQTVNNYNRTISVDASINTKMDAEEIAFLLASQLDARGRY